MASPNNARSAAAADALAAARAELRDHTLDRDRLSWLYADRVLRSDDAFGRRHGLVVQAAAVRWSNLDAVLDLAIYGNLAHRQLVHGGGIGARDCPQCAQAVLLWNNALFRPVMLDRHIEASVLLARLRPIVLADLNLRPPS